MTLRDVHPSILKFTGAHPLASKPGVDDRAEGGGDTTPSSARPSVLYLGLDQDGGKLPWARGHPAMQRPETGTFGLPSWIAPNGQPDLAVPQEGVFEFIFRQAREGVTHVISEKPYVGPNGSVVEKLFTIRAAVAHACLKADLHWRQVPVAKWRLEFIGVGEAPSFIKPDKERRAWLKAQAIKTCERREWPVGSEDEAEACGVLNYGLCVDYPEYAQSHLPMFYTRSHS